MDRLHSLYYLELDPTGEIFGGEAGDRMGSASRFALGRLNAILEIAQRPLAKPGQPKGPVLGNPKTLRRLRGLAVHDVLANLGQELVETLGMGEPVSVHGLAKQTLQVAEPGRDRGPQTTGLADGGSSGVGGTRGEGAGTENGRSNSTAKGFPVILRDARSLKNVYFPFGRPFLKQNSATLFPVPALK